MDNQSTNQYNPDFVTPPGDTLLEMLESIGMTQAELAERTGRPRKTINEIVKGVAGITADTALQLERVLGAPSGFWLNREQQYREWLTRHHDREAMAQHAAWLQEFPVRAMVRKNWIRKCAETSDQVIELLRFFGVAHPDQWEKIWRDTRVAYRKSPAFLAVPAAISAWLRKGEIEGAAIPCKPYDHAAFLAALNNARVLTRLPPAEFAPALIRQCAEAGVAVVFVPELPGAHVSGATRWQSSTKALIMLSLRHKTDDHLWFTFFHEAGHILLHGKREVFLDNNDTGRNDSRENEANQFAQDLLIPAVALEDLKPSGTYYSHAYIDRFAEKLGIAPGIVVGRLQHDRIIPKNHFNDFRRHIEWATDFPEVVRP